MWNVSETPPPPSGMAPQRSDPAAITRMASMREVFSETENKGGASSIESSTLLDVIESTRRGKRLNQAQVPCHSVAFSLSVLLSPSSLSLSLSLSLTLDQSIDLFLSLSTKGADNLAAKLFALGCMMRPLNTC
jgi:hypothetical protein